jgi:hypothetical protein
MGNYKINIMKYKQILLSLLISTSLTYNSNGQETLTNDKINTKQLKPAILYWDFGAPEYLTIESVYPIKDSINSYWSVSHRSPIVDDTVGNGFDYYLVNEKGLRPVISHMYHLGFTNYYINFKSDTASLSIKSMRDTVNYKVKIPEILAPEGPGMSVFLGSLKFSKQFHISYYELNRWAGTPPRIGQLELTELKVVGTEKLEIDGQFFDTFKVFISSKSGRFTEVWVLKTAPHYWVKVNHKIDEKRTIRSRVVKMYIFGAN